MPFSCSSWTSELNGPPDGSRPTRCQSWSPSSPRVSASPNTLEIDWMEKRSRQSPTPYMSPSTVATAMPNLSAGTEASAGM